jgi:molybdopterin-synthase adenylyltransferase
MKYLRQETLKEIGKKGQQKIAKAKIAIIGVGALGTITSELLARAGIGKLLLIDKDLVHEVNLQRQLFEEKDKGKEKVLAMKERIQKINSLVEVETITDYLSNKNTNSLDDYDLILDCTDNMRSRHIINDYCAKKNKIWIHAAGSGIKGNVLVVDNPEKFAKIFKSAESFDSCEEIGVINTLTTIIASLQVTEAIKIITQQNYCKDLIRFNLWENSYQKIKF